MKFTQTDYATPKGILKFPDHYVGRAIMIDSSQFTAGSDGKKIAKAGTILNNAWLKDTSQKAKPATTADGSSDAGGVLLVDVDLTYGDAPGTVIIHGFIDLNKLPTAPTTEEESALKQITFLA